jgi:hypothetical protein
MKVKSRMEIIFMGVAYNTANLLVFGRIPCWPLFFLENSLTSMHKRSKIGENSVLSAKILAINFNMK